MARLSGASTLSSTTRIRRREGAAAAGGRASPAVRRPAPAAGQAHDELAALARGRRCGHRRSRRASRPASHQRQADAEPALRAVQGHRSAWVNRSKMREHLAGDADPVSRTRNSIALVGSRRQPADPAAGVGVLGGVVQQVAEHLLQPRGVALDRQWARRHRTLSSWLVVDQRPARSPRRRATTASRPPFLLQVDLAAGDPRDVEQVVDQPGQVLDLPLDDVARPAPGSGVARHARA